MLLLHNQRDYKILTRRDIEYTILFFVFFSGSQASVSKESNRLQSRGQTLSNLQLTLVIHKTAHFKDPDHLKGTDQRPDLQVSSTLTTERNMHIIK